MTIMSKEDRDVTRAVMDAIGYGEAMFDAWRPKITQLLDALDAFDLRLQYADDLAHEAMDGYKKMVEGKCGVYQERGKCDRDHWKDRAEMYERGCSGQCFSCVYLYVEKECEPCTECNCSGVFEKLGTQWEFAESRFRTEGGMEE